MRKNILRTIILVGFFLFAGLQLLPLLVAMALGFELFPHWPILAVAVGLLVFGSCFAGLLWLERKDLFGSREKGKERLSSWLIALGVNAMVEALVLFFLNMIVVQPLVSWLNGTFQLAELGLSSLFLVIGAIVVALFWLLSLLGKQARGKE